MAGSGPMSRQQRAKAARAQQKEVIARCQTSGRQYAVRAYVVMGRSETNGGWWSEDVLLELLEDDEQSPEMSALLVTYVSSALRRPLQGRGWALASTQEAITAILSRCARLDAGVQAGREAFLRGVDPFCIGMLASGRSLSPLHLGTLSQTLERIPSVLQYLHVVTTPPLLDQGSPSMSMQLAVELVIALHRTLGKSTRRQLSSPVLKPAVDLAVERLIATLQEDEMAPSPFRLQLGALLRYLNPTAARKAVVSEPQNVPLIISANALLAAMFLKPGGLATSPALDAEILAFAHHRLASSGKIVAELMSAAAQLGSPKAGVQSDVDLAWAALMVGGRMIQLLDGLRTNLRSSWTDELRIGRSDMTELQSIIAPPTKTVDLAAVSSPDPSRQDIWTVLADQLREAGLVDSSYEVQAGESLALGAIDALFSDLRSALPSDESLPSLASATVTALEAAESSADVATLCALTSSFSSFPTQRILLLWRPPSAYLAPICRVLDSWGTASGADSGTQHSFEQFGSLLGWLSSFVFRFDIAPSDFELHLGSAKGFVASYLLTSSVSFPIQELSAERQKTMSSWIGALYGVEGISDDLLSGTDSKELVRLAPTLFRQSFDALQKGEVDADAVKEGLSYFEQALLGGCAMAVVGWLIGELERIGFVSPGSLHQGEIDDTSRSVPAPHQPVVLEIFQSMILSTSISPLQLEPLASRALRLVRAYAATHPSPTLLPSRTALDIRGLMVRLATLEGTLTSPMAVLGGDAADSLLVGLGWEGVFRAALELEVAPSTTTPVPRRQRLWGLLGAAPKVLGAQWYVNVVLEGTVKSVPAAGSGKVWDAAVWERRDRAVAVAVAALTWEWHDERERTRVPAEFVMAVLKSSQETAEDIEAAVLREAEMEVVNGCLEVWDARKAAYSQLGVPLREPQAWQIARTRDECNA